jgi:hypothetical protein
MHWIDQHFQRSLASSRNKIFDGIKIKYLLHQL